MDIVSKIAATGSATSNREGLHVHLTRRRSSRDDLRDGAGWRPHPHPYLGGTDHRCCALPRHRVHGRVWNRSSRVCREHFSIVSSISGGTATRTSRRRGYDWTKFGDDTLAVIDELGLVSPAGLDTPPARRARVRETDRPGTFSKLVTDGPRDAGAGHRRSWRRGNPMAEQARRRRAIWSSTDEMIERLKRDAARDVARGLPALRT